MTQRVLRKMELNLYKSPKDVLNKFYSRMREPGDPTEISLTVQDEPDSERLASDLKRMANEVIDTRLLCKVPEIILVSGGLDRVVPKSQLQSIEESIVDVVQHIHIPDAGHNIPQTHTSKCLPLVLNQ
ncbi:MAG: alpha/beta hydrolase [Balneolaceae bacterium]